MTREVAIDIIKCLAWHTRPAEEDIEQAIKTLEQEPQTFEWCHDCKEYDHEKHCCPRYNKVIRNTVEEIKQPCEDAISRVEVQTTIEMSASRYIIAKERNGMGQVEWSDQLIKVSDAVDIIRHLSSVTPQEQKTGQWVLLDECSNSGYYCSECHKKLVKEGWSGTVKKIKYCPNCGAKMIDPQESEDKE